MERCDPRKESRLEIQEVARDHEAMRKKAEQDKLDYLRKRDEDSKK